MPSDSTRKPLSTHLIDRCTELMRGRRVLVLSGAGMSTGSGIPDYRGPAARPRRPIQHQDFVRSETVRARYWSRSLIGWPAIRDAEPCDAHHRVTELEAHGSVFCTITQNVDRLHQLAGSRSVVELHGALAEVRCLDCSQVELRENVQRRLLHANPDFLPDLPGYEEVETAPDGDAEVSPEVTARFRVVGCAGCGGVLKPDVVFFGGSVPKERVEFCYDALERADVLLVLGSSLTVFSGYRFVLRARDWAKPVIIVNQGPTRGDDLAALKMDAELAGTLAEISSRLRTSASRLP